MQTIKANPNGKTMYTAKKHRIAYHQRAHFAMETVYYDNQVDEETGEVLQKRFVHRGDDKRKQYILKSNINLLNDLTALLYHLYWIQKKCEQVRIYDNSMPVSQNIILEIRYGLYYHPFFVTPTQRGAIRSPETIIADAERARQHYITLWQKNYPVFHRRFIRDWRIVPHDAVVV